MPRLSLNVSVDTSQIDKHKEEIQSLVKQGRVDEANKVFSSIQVPCYANGRRIGVVFPGAEWEIVGTEEKESVPIICWNEWRAKRLGVPVENRFPKTIIDANGLEWDKDVIWCNTETGEMEIAERDENGMLQKADCGTEVKTRIEKTAAPLRVIWEN